MADNQQFTISRVVNAPLSLVWKMYSEAEHLAKWWGPKGSNIEIAAFDFRPGGIFHYSMGMPNGQRLWGKFMYREIEPQTKIVFVNAFSDEKGNVTRNPWAPTWPLEVFNTMTLAAKGNQTEIYLAGGPFNATEEERNTFLSAFDSMNAGFKGTFEQLDEYLASLQQ